MTLTPRRWPLFAPRQTTPPCTTCELVFFVNCAGMLLRDWTLPEAVPIQKDGPAHGAFAPHGANSGHLRLVSGISGLLFSSRWL